MTKLTGDNTPKCRRFIRNPRHGAAIQPRGARKQTGPELSSLAKISQNIRYCVCIERPFNNVVSTIMNLHRSDPRRCCAALPLPRREPRAGRCPLPLLPHRPRNHAEDVQLSVWSNESMMSEAFSGFYLSDLDMACARITTTCGPCCLCWRFRGLRTTARCGTSTRRCGGQGGSGALHPSPLRGCAALADQLQPWGRMEGAHQQVHRGHSAQR